MKQNLKVRRIGDVVNDYESANRFLGSKDERKLANNTLVVRGAEGSIGVVLHRTTVVRYYPDGRVQLDSGGWRTVTTKQRMNQLLSYPWRVDQTKREWYVRDIRSQESIEFEDGMVLGGEATEHLVNPPGKFSDSIEELLYGLDHDQSLGSSDELGWYGLVSGLTKPEAKAAAADLDIEWDEGDAKQYDWPLNAIIREDSDGFVTVNSFKANRDMMREWRDLEAEYEEYYEAGGG